jgi:DNA-binding MarR family transcriptional regulator
MTELDKEPGLRVSDIARRLSIKISTASNMLDKIEQKKLLSRKRGNDDQRIVKLYLTSAGKKLLKQAPDSPQGPVLDAIDCMTINQARQLHESLQLLVKNIDSSSNILPAAPLDTI